MARFILLLVLGTLVTSRGSPVREPSATVMTSLSTPPEDYLAYLE